MYRGRLRKESAVSASRKSATQSIVAVDSSRQPIPIFLSREDRDSARVTLTVLAGRRDREIGIASECSRAFSRPVKSAEWIIFRLATASNRVAAGEHTATVTVVSGAFMATDRK